MSKRIITFITGSPQKLREVRAVLGDNFLYTVSDAFLTMLHTHDFLTKARIKRCRFA